MLLGLTPFFYEVFMRKHVCYLFILISGFHSPCWSDSHKSAKVLRAEKILSKLDVKAEEFIELLNVPGAAIGVVVDGEIVYAKSFGARNIAESLPVTSKTLFPIGSATKAFTSFLIGQLQDEGFLHWDDPIAEYIPGFKLINPFTTYEMTIRDNLTHVNGYSRNDAAWFGAKIPRDEMIRRMRYFEPAFGFRERFCYGNYGYLLAGHAAEKVTNKSWEDLLDEYIFNPIGMTHTTGDQKVFLESKDRSLGYRETEIGLSATHLIDAYTIGPAASLHSNLDDMLEWVKLLTKKGDRLIQRETFNEIIKPQVISNIILNGRWGIEDLIMMETYGLGWFVISYRHHEAIFHGGNIEGFSSSVLFFPNENFGLVVLTNKNYTPLPHILGCEVADTLLGITPIDWVERLKQFKDYDAEFYFKDSDAKKAGQVEGTTPSHPMRDFTGLYENPGYGTIEFKLKDDRLEARYNNTRLVFDHWHYDTFEISKDTNIPDITSLKASFRHNFFGDVDSVVIPFEPLVNDIVFKKKKEDKLFEKDYLNNFLGTFKYLGFSFIVSMEKNSLVVRALGQPPFILIPEKDGLFSVVDYEGYTVQFLVDDDDAITAVQLIQPNNTTYTAYKEVTIDVND